jgi:hypothetical protein
MTPVEIYQSWKLAEESLDSKLEMYGNSPGATPSVARESAKAEPLSLQELYSARQSNSPEWQQYISEVEKQWNQ